MIWKARAIAFRHFLEALGGATAACLRCGAGNFLVFPPFPTISRNFVAGAGLPVVGQAGENWGQKFPPGHFRTYWGFSPRDAAKQSFTEIMVEEGHTAWQRPGGRGFRAMFPRKETDIHQGNSEQLPACTTQPVIPAEAGMTGGHQGLAINSRISKYTIHILSYSAITNNAFRKISFHLVDFAVFFARCNVANPSVSDYNSANIVDFGFSLLPDLSAQPGVLTG